MEEVAAAPETVATGPLGALQGRGMFPARAGSSPRPRHDARGGGGSRRHVVTLGDVAIGGLSAANDLARGAIREHLRDAPALPAEFGPVRNGRPRPGTPCWGRWGTPVPLRGPAGAVGSAACRRGSLGRCGIVEHLLHAGRRASLAGAAAHRGPATLLSLPLSLTRREGRVEVGHLELAGDLVPLFAVTGRGGPTARREGA